MVKPLSYHQPVTTEAHVNVKYFNAVSEHASAW